MNYLKRIAVILLLFLIIIVAISFFLPSSFHMERKIIINADKEQVFKQVNDLKNWGNWSVWALKDPTIYNNEEAFSSQHKGSGASFNWDSKNDELGSGSIKIVLSTTNKYIENSIDLGMSEITGTWNFNDAEGGVEVVWGMDVDFGFNPFSKFFGLFMKGGIFQEPKW